MRTCQHCNGLNLDDAQFCSRCGQAVQEVQAASMIQQPVPAAQATPHARRVFWLFGSGVLVLMLIVIGVLVWPFIFGDGLQPQQVVTNYCQALASHDYARAYSYLDLETVGPDSPTSPQSLQQLAPQIYHGMISNCNEVTSRTVTQLGGTNMAQVNVMMQYIGENDAGYTSANVAFFLQTFHNSWKITGWWFM